MNINGRLPSYDLAKIPGGKLRKDAAAAWLDMRRHILKAGGPDIRPGGPDSSYRSFVRQVYWKQYWTNQGQPYKAAEPGTSNHGWGLAVDEPNSRSQWWINKVGSKFGWSHSEGAAVGEPWHFTYVGGYKPGEPTTDPLTSEERRWVNKLKSSKSIRTRRAVKRRLVARRKYIWKVAQRSGWHKARRRERYNILRRLTK